MNWFSIIAGRRTGTQMLSAMLRSHSDVFVSDEIFNTFSGTVDEIYRLHRKSAERSGRVAAGTLIHRWHGEHFPEYYQNGIDGMSLLDLVEMFVDWKAASERHASGNVEKSIQINSKRFGMSPQLAAIFENTRLELGW